MRIVHIGTGDVDDYRDAFRPFIGLISQKIGTTDDAILDEIASGETHIHLAIGDQPEALAGTRFEKHGDGLLCHLVWCAGNDAPRWFHLIEAIENWARSHGARRMMATARPGWRKMLTSNDYAMTHVVMEKDL